MHSKFIAKEQHVNNAPLRTHELATRTTLFADENRSLSQQLGTTGLRERALTGKLTEKSEEFYDVVVVFYSMRATFNVGESKLRDEFSMLKGENMQLRVHMEWANDEVARVARTFKDCEVSPSLQKTKIYDLERVVLSGDIRRGPTKWQYD